MKATMTLEEARTKLLHDADCHYLKYVRHRDANLYFECDCSRSVVLAALDEAEKARQVAVAERGAFLRAAKKDMEEQGQRIAELEAELSQLRNAE